MPCSGSSRDSLYTTIMKLFLLTVVTFWLMLNQVTYTEQSDDEDFLNFALDKMNDCELAIWRYYIKVFALIKKRVNLSIFLF